MGFSRLEVDYPCGFEVSQPRLAGRFQRDGRKKKKKKKKLRPSVAVLPAEANRPQQPRPTEGASDRTARCSMRAKGLALGFGLFHPFAISDCPSYSKLKLHFNIPIT